MSFQLAEAYVQLSRRGFDGVMSGINAVKSGLGSLVSFAAGPLGAAMAGIGAGVAVAGMVKMASNAEQLEIAFGTMLGSADKAKQMIASLSQFAAKTPFEMPGITQAARSLMAFGTSEDQVIPLLRILGDVSAGTGKDLSELAVIFGQISATGKLTGGDLMQLTNAGVPMLKTLADMLGKTTGEVKQMVENGEISSGMVTQAFQKMSGEGGLFANMMEKQSGTLGGLWSTLTDTIGQGALAIGQALVDGFDLKSAVANLTSFVERVRGEWMPSIVASLQWAKTNMVQPFFSAIGSMANFMLEFIQDFDLYWEYAYTSLGNWMNNCYQIVTTAFSNAWTVTKWFFSNFFGIASNVFMNLPKLFMNYVQMIINQWKAVLNFFKTGKIEIDWSPLQEAAKLIFKDIEMPKLATAQTDVLQSDLDSIAGRLAKRQADRQKKASDKAKQGVEDQQAALRIEDDLQAGITEEKEKQTKENEKQKASYSSLADLADKMQQDLFGNQSGAGGGVGAVDAVANAGGKAIAQAGGQAVQIDSLTRQVSLLESLLSLAQGSGIRVSMPESGSVRVPAASVQFGATGG